MKLAPGEQLHETRASLCEEQVRYTAGHQRWGQKSRRDFGGDWMDLAAQYMEGVGVEGMKITPRFLAETTDWVWVPKQRMQKDRRL